MGYPQWCVDVARAKGVLIGKEDVALLVISTLLQLDIE